jgi:hypothetical protein
MRATWCAVTVCVVLSCGGQVNPSIDAGTDAHRADVQVHDSGVPTTEGGGPYDAAVDASSCPAIDTYCSMDGATCIHDWTTASSSSTWCATGTDATNPVPLNPSDNAIYAFPSCDGYNVVVVDAVDVTTTYFYDETSGALMGIGAGPGDPSNDSTWTPRCLAGSFDLKGTTTFSLSGCSDGGFAFSLCQTCETCGG